MVVPLHLESLGPFLSSFLAWVMGAGDPTSGTVALHEVVRGLGELLQTGWKPLRTIILASWDGEEVWRLHSLFELSDFMVRSTV